MLIGLTSVGRESAGRKNSNGVPKGLNSWLFVCLLILEPSHWIGRLGCCVGILRAETTGLCHQPGTSAEVDGRDLNEAGEGALLGLQAAEPSRWSLWML